jgi:hypothetical protein
MCVWSLSPPSRAAAPRPVPADELALDVVPDQLARIARRWYAVPAGLRAALAVDNPAVGARVREPVVPAVDGDAVVAAAPVPTDRPGTDEGDEVGELGSSVVPFDDIPVRVVVGIVVAKRQSIEAMKPRGSKRSAVKPSSRSCAESASTQRTYGVFAVRNRH